MEVDGEKIEDGEIDLTLSDGEAVVSTDYSVIEEGFGENYLGDYELELEIDVSDFNISAELGDLSVNLIYDGQILASESETIIVEGAELAAESNLSFTGGIGMIRIPFGGFAEINLSDYFINAEEYLLNCSNITGVVSSDVMTLTPDAGFRGARLCKISGYLDENLVESNEFNVLVSSGAFNVLTSHSRIKVGEPVKWKANVSLEVVESVIVELPGEAENISVRKIEGGEEKETAVSINAGVVIDVQKSNKNLIDYIFELFGTITGRTVSENESAQGTIEVGLNDNATEYVIEYITEAPVAVESETGFGKEVVISGPDELNYTDVLAFASINEIFEVGQEGKIKIYWHNYDYNESAAGFEEINFIYTKNNKKEGFERNDEPSRINNFPSPEFNNKDSSKYLNVSDKENKKGSSPYSSLDFEVNNYNSEVKTLAPGAANSFITGNVIDGGVIRTDSEGRNYRLQEIAFDAYDLDSNGKLDYVEWIVPHLSNQTFEIILIIKAEHLDANRTFVEDVYSLVSIRDYNYSLIPVGDYLRVTFEQNLTSQKDITIYGKSSGVASVEVYEKDENDLIARFENVSEDKEYKIYLNDLNGSQDTFDLLVVGEDVEFDYVVDPSITIVSPENINYTLLPLYFNVSVSEDATVNYTLDGGITNISMSSIDNRSFNATNESIADGGYNFTAYVFQGGTLYIRSVVFSVDVNFPPNQPSLISPLNLSTGNSLTPILNVSVTDNDNDAMNVTFWNKFVSMDAGYEHTCGIIANGSAMCWGYNNHGQIGDGTNGTDRLNPVFVNTTNSFISIDSGDWHSCGLLSNGSAMCWGYNNYGQIGDGTNGTDRLNPVFVNTTNKFVSIDAGDWHSCGLLANGSAMCWGANDFGKIGDGTTTTPRVNPVFVNTTNTFVSVSAGGRHSCGIISNGSAMCWGYNGFGGIGDGTTTTQRVNPVFVNTTNMFSSSVIGNSTNIANGSSTFVNWTNLSLTSSLGLSYSSTYLWRVSADDGNGNLANSPIWQFTTLDANDTTAPIITINLPANDSNFNISSIGFNVSINENASWCGLSISGLANETMTLNATGTGANYTNSSIADGSYTFVVSCNDTANNYGTSSSYNFLVDTLYPSINFTGETPASGSNQTATSIIVNVSSNDTNQHYVVTNFDDSLVGWWRLDNNGPGENSTKVYDWSGRGNNGTVVIVDSSRIGPVTNGKFGGGFEFSGLANVINVNISEQSLTDSSSFAYSAWIKRAVDDTTEDEVINNGNRQIYVTGRKVVAYMEGNHLTGATTLQSETWYHVAFTYEHSTQIQTLYLNGILDGTSNNSVLSGIASDFYIGRCQYSAHEHEFNGTIDEVIVFNRSLSSSEILALYNASATKYYNNFTGLSVGNHTFKSYAIDLAGNLNSTEERNVTIYSRPVVTLVSPNASSTTTDRTPTFNWTGSDADGDQISYEFNISLIAGGGSTCVDSIARGVKLAGTNYTLPLDLGCLYDNGNVYNWSVRANDSIGYGVWASRLINISSSIAITMVNGSINFGSLIPNVSVNTTDASYAPFVVENRGNSLINISVLSNVLWTTESSASKYFQFKADNYTGHEGAFSWASSSIAWRNMSTSAQTCVSNLNYTALNRSEVDILLWVSPGELVSNKSFTITFTASLSEGA